MATIYAPSIVHLTTKEFPPEFENVFCPRNQSPKQNAAAEKVLVAGADRRHRIMTTDVGFWHFYGGRALPFIGLLRMEFSGTYFTGTATMIADGSCLLTCAHNVVEYDATTKTFMAPTSMWFEFRENNPESGSVLIKRYKVTNFVVYPPYFEDPSSASGSDLALCWIDMPEDDHTMKEQKSNYDGAPPDPLSGHYGTDMVVVVGFPGEHKGEKWGMVGYVPADKEDEWLNMEETYKTEGKEILVYDFVDTSPGQSGSPVMGVDSSHIIGVHTGGSASLKKNWATYISPAKLEWIVGCLGSSYYIGTSFGGALDIMRKK